MAWLVPVLPNGILLGYQLHQREAKPGSSERIVYRGIGFSTRVIGLSPYTTYEFRVSANTSVGPGYGPYSRVTTLEDGKCTYEVYIILDKMFGTLYKFWFK